MCHFRTIILEVVLGFRTSQFALFAPLLDHLQHQLNHSDFNETKVLVVIARYLLCCKLHHFRIARTDFKTLQILDGLANLCNHISEKSISPIADIL
jgi:hypothetical protein